MSRHTSTTTASANDKQRLSKDCYKNVENIGTREAICIPRGATHRWANNGTVPAKQLTVISPGVMRPEYFREVKQLLSGGPPNPAAMAETMRRHGMIPVVPAPAPESTLHEK